MPPQIISRVIRGADDLYARHGNDLARGQFPERLIGPLPYILAGIRAQRFFDIKIALKLQMGPVVQRIADQKRQSLRPLLKLLIG